MRCIDKINGFYCVVVIKSIFNRMHASCSGSTFQFFLPLRHLDMFWCNGVLYFREVKAAKTRTKTNKALSVNFNKLKAKIVVLEPLTPTWKWVCNVEKNTTNTRQVLFNLYLSNPVILKEYQAPIQIRTKAS